MCSQRVTIQHEWHKTFWLDRWSFNYLNYDLYIRILLRYYLKYLGFFWRVLWYTTVKITHSIFIIDIGRPHSLYLTVDCSSNSYRGATVTIKLAVINILNILGAYEEWSMFHDINTATIHKFQKSMVYSDFSFAYSETVQFILFIETIAMYYVE